MALILNLETATRTCSVALAEDGIVIGFKEEASEKFLHAEKLNLFIQEVLSVAKKLIGDLDAVAVSAGPGSYTGLRIGTSTAKGICFALNIPLIAINSLKALAALKKIENGLICPMLDARRMEVYTSVYDKDLNVQVGTDAIVIDKRSFGQYLSKSAIFFIGPGAEKCVEIILHKNAIFDLELEVSARGMAPLSFQKFRTNDFEDVAYFEPLYLKDFVAGTPKKLL